MDFCTDRCTEHKYELLLECECNELQQRTHRITASAAAGDIYLISERSAVIVKDQSGREVEEVQYSTVFLERKGFEKLLKRGHELLEDA